MRGIIVCWITFLFFWFVSAFWRKATAERQSLRRELAYLLPTIAGALLLAWPRYSSSLNVRLPAGTDWAGAAFCVLGLAVTLWSRWTLGRNWSSAVTFRTDHQLIERGPYR